MQGDRLFWISVGWRRTYSSIREMVAAEGRRNNDPCCMFAPSFLIMDLVCIPFMFGLNKQARVRWLTIKQTLELNSSDECWMSLFSEHCVRIGYFRQKVELCEPIHWYFKWFGGTLLNLEY